MTETNLRISLELPDIDQFNNGTENYHKVLPFGNQLVSDGVMYVMACGYSWLVTDALIVMAMKPKLKKEEFLVVELHLHGGDEGRMTIEDGNKHVLYRQKYAYTNAQKELKFYYENGVLMLPDER